MANDSKNSREPPYRAEDALADTHLVLEGEVLEPGLPGGDIPEKDAFVGKVLGGRYRVVKVIGRGGMATVYEAEHVSLATAVAVKVLDPRPDGTLEDVKRFRQEAQIMAQLRHPHVAVVSDLGQTDDGRQYLVMERLEGQDLREALKSEPEERMSSARTIGIALQICQAMSAAHGRQIIHRDLKPENIFLTISPAGERDFVKILDFGIARIKQASGRLTTLTVAGTTLGTIQYMSPEQAAGKPVDQRADIYALGVIIHEMLTGQTPHHGSDILEVLNRKATEDVVSLRQARPDLGVPVALDKLVLRSLAREPEERPGSMDEVAGELKTLMESGSRAAALTTTGEHLAGLRRRWPKLWLWVAVPAVVVVAVCVGLMLMAKDAPDATVLVKGNGGEKVEKALGAPVAARTGEKKLSAPVKSAAPTALVVSAPANDGGQDKKGASLAKARNKPKRKKPALKTPEIIAPPPPATSGVPFEVKVKGVP